MFVNSVNTNFLLYSFKIKQWVKHNLCPQILYNLDPWGLFIKLSICYMPSDPCWPWLLAWEIPLRGSWYAENGHGALRSNLEYRAKITMWNLEKRNYDQILKLQIRAKKVREGFVRQKEMYLERKSWGRGWHNCPPLLWPELLLLMERCYGEAGVLGRDHLIQREKLSNALGKITLGNLSKYNRKLSYLWFQK